MKSKYEITKIHLKEWVEVEVAIVREKIRKVSNREDKKEDTSRWLKHTLSIYLYFQVLLIQHSHNHEILMCGNKIIVSVSFVAFLQVQVSLCFKTLGFSFPIMFRHNSL